MEVDVRVGLKKAELLNIIGGYDGLAVRSATKADKDVIAAAKNLKVIGRAGIGVDNIDIPAATARGIVVMNTPFGNSITTAEHAIALLFAAARQIARGGRLHPGGEVGKEPLHGGGAVCQDLGTDRLRQHRRAGRGAGAGAQNEGHRLRSFPLARSAR